MQGVLEVFAECNAGSAIARKLLIEDVGAQGAEIVREKGRLDLCIELKKLQVIIGIENKIDSSEHSDQLLRYADFIDDQYQTWDRMYLYLTLDGEQPSDPQSHSITHRRVLTMIGNRMPRLDATTPEPVRAFIEHYVDLLKEIYSLRPEKRRSAAEVHQLLDKWVMEDAEVYWTVPEETPGLNRTLTLLRRIVQVPKADVDRRIAENKEARKALKLRRKENRRRF